MLINFIMQDDEAKGKLIDHLLKRVSQQDASTNDRPFSEHELKAHRDFLVSTKLVKEEVQRITEEVLHTKEELLKGAKLKEKPAAKLLKKVIRDYVKQELDHLFHLADQATDLEYDYLAKIHGLKSKKEKDTFQETVEQRRIKILKNTQELSARIKNLRSTTKKLSSKSDAACLIYSIYLSPLNT